MPWGVLLDAALFQMSRMPSHVFGHECRYEVVRMIVPILKPDVCGHAGFFADFNQQFGLELLFEKAIGRALIHQ